MENLDNSFQLAEDKGRSLFLKYFAQFVKSSATTSQFCSHDLDVTGLTDIVSAIEIKAHYDGKSIREFSGNSAKYSSILKLVKIDHFKSLMKDNPNLQCLFMHFFNDGVLIFNISNRILYNKQLKSEPFYMYADSQYNYNKPELYDVCKFSINYELGDRMYRINENKLEIIK